MGAPLLRTNGRSPSSVGLCLALLHVCPPCPPPVVSCLLGRKLSCRIGNLLTSAWHFSSGEEFRASLVFPPSQLQLNLLRLPQLLSIALPTHADQEIPELSSLGSLLPPKSSEELCISASRAHLPIPLSHSSSIKFATARPSSQLHPSHLIFVSLYHVLASPTLQSIPSRRRASLRFCTPDTALLPPPLHILHLHPLIDSHRALRDTRFRPSDFRHHLIRYRPAYRRLPQSAHLGYR